MRSARSLVGKIWALPDSCEEAAAVFADQVTGEAPDFVDWVKELLFRTFEHLDGSGGDGTS